MDSNIVLGDKGSTASADFLNWLFSGRDNDQISICAFKPLSMKTSATFGNVTDAAAYAASLDAAGAEGTYFRLATLPADWSPLQRAARGSAAESAFVYALSADLDLNGPGHTPKKLPYPDAHEDLVHLLEKAGIPEPSAWLHSGGGRYPIWKFSARVPAADAAPISSALHRHLIGWSNFLGWAMDNTSDVARVYRLPGTHNRKPDRPDHPVAYVMSWDGPLYEMADFARTLRAAPAAPGVLSAAPVSGAPVSAVPAADHLFASPSDFGTSARVRTNYNYTDDDAAKWLDRQIEAMREKLRNEGVWKALSGFVLLCVRFERDFPHWMTRELIVKTIARVCKEERGWPELDAEDHDKIQRTFARWDSGRVEDAWHAVRIETAPDPAVARSTAKERLLASLMTLDQLRSLPQPQPLIKGVIDFESINWLIGAPGGFKTFVAIDWACHVAAGRDWNGKKVSEGKVIYIAAEGRRAFLLRIDAWKLHHGVADLSNLLVLPMPVRARGRDGKGSSEEWLALAEIVSEIKPAMVVLDTQARMAVGWEENNNTEMQLWIDAVDQLKDASGGAVLVVHHTGRNGGDARGASALDGAQDSEWKVTRKAHKLAMTLNCEKRKDGDDSAKWHFEMTEVPMGLDRDGEPITSLVIGAQTEGAHETPHSVVSARANDGKMLTLATLITRVLDEYDQMRDGLTMPKLQQYVKAAFTEAGETPAKEESVRTAVNRLRGGESPAVDKNGDRYLLTEPPADPDPEL